ncbi:MAG: efflux RND transporter periplasmic adaptor subunit [Lachnospiraceae bacterium]|nr:efflux RND transporter periplasmic adaptor subunit [Lachnospiraceae bacterium]
MEKGEKMKELTIKKEKSEKQPRTKMNPRKKKKIWIGVIVGVVVIAIGFTVINSAIAKEKGVMVDTITAAKGDIQSSIETSGSVKSEVTRTYFSDATTKTNIQDVNVAVGDVVKEGEQLLTFDIASLEANSKQVILTGESSAYAYQGEAQENAKYQAQLEKAVTDVQNYQAIAAFQKKYVKELEDSISDEKIKKRADLYSQQYSLNRSINNFNYELGKEDLESKKRDTYRKLIEDYNNELSRVGNELSKLEDYKTKDNLEDKLIQAKNDYSDLEIAHNEAKSRQQGAEAAIKNAAALKSAQLSSEANQAVAENAARVLENAKKGIVADFSGVITKVNATAGGPAIDGTELLTLESNKNVKVQLSVSKYDLETLAEGQKADITINGNAYTGVVSKINHVALPNAAGTPMVTVEVHIQDGDDKVVLGIEAKVIIHTREAKDVVMAPIESVNADNKGDFCYVVNGDGIVEKRNVVIGISSDDYTEIKEGLNEGDQIIPTLPVGVSEGSHVMTMNSTEATTQAAE